jgi:drug/metabolite transporter (DMT)-like permease
MYLLCLSGGIGSFVKGDAYVMACAVVFSFHILAIDKYSPRVNGVALSCIQFFVAGVLNVGAMFIFETPKLDLIVGAGIPILYAGVLSCGVAYTLQIIGQKRSEPTVASIIMCLESVIGAIASAIILHERMLPREYLGSAIVFFAVILSQLTFGKKKTGSADACGTPE